MSEKESKKESEYNDLSVDDIFNFMDLYYNRRFVMYSHLYNSMNKFFDEDVRQFMENGEHSFYEKVTKNKIFKNKFVYENISIKEPTLENEAEPMFPSDARDRDLTYSTKLLAKVTQIQEITDISTDEREIKIIGEPEENIPIANLPVMVRSKYCSLSLHKNNDKKDCRYDPGGYFIVNGSEKVVISQDRMIDNKPLVFIKKDSGVETYSVQVNSKSFRPNGITQVISIKLKKDGNITIRVPIFDEVNVFTLFRAMNVISDKNILDYICPDSNDFQMIDMIRNGLLFCKTDKEHMKIQSQEQAIDYLSGKLRVLKKYSDGDKTTKTNQKKIHITTLFENNFLPHIEGGVVSKVYYLGYMINRLIRCVLKRIPIDDRDSYLNKRVDLPGELIFELFRQSHRQMLNNCGSFFKKRCTSDDSPLNIISQIKPNTIEQGIKTSLLTGAWPRRKGVAQVLQRMSYPLTISFLRRVDTPGGDASTSKITGPRHLHPSTAGFLCCLTGDSNILQENGTDIKQIKDMNESDNVMSVYYKNENLTYAPTGIKNYFCRMSEKLFEIETISGRKIKCTHDHPILTRINNKYIMKKADELKEGDEVIEYMNYSEQQIDYDPFVNKCHVNGDFISMPIKSKKTLPNEMVYDFETKLDSHSFIVNGIVTSNCAQTPEHAKVGLTKHLSLNASVSIIQNSQIYLIKNMIKRKVMKLQDIPIHKVYKYTKVFVNGDWIGVSDDPNNLVNELRKNKENNVFDPQCSIVYDVPEHEIHVYCDSGRLIRPIMKVNDNKIKLTKKILENVSLDKSDAIEGKITSWEELMIKHTGVVEYIDMEEQPYLMISESLDKVEEMRQKKLNSIEDIKSLNKSKNNLNITDNRYNDKFLYVNYTHCEFHPSFLVGEIITTVPLCNHNAGPRAVFFYAQDKQGKGIYATNYRHRLDISYILYHPQKRLITTRTGKYVFADVMAGGENVVVAICTYTGFNQEDSIVFNMSAIERGLFRSTLFKKYSSQIQKNQSTSQDDEFTKPDMTKVSGMKNPDSYNKLNDKGYVPEETAIVDGDVIIGKVSPIQPTGNSKKVFKDSSEVYKSYTPGVIDKVYTNIHTNEGYEMRKVRVRSERTPRIGDKFCSSHGQKGTIGLYLKHSDMPFTKYGIVPDLIINPNGQPSRMTMAQLIEMTYGKSCAINGHEGDGTPFNNTDISSIRNELEKIGYKSSGKEDLYNGMTGRKMKTEIFIGPIYYLRLKHMVEDKFHSRARGPRTLLMHQPPDGRARDGGLRMGEMEKDALLAHGLSKFLKEKLMDTSDAYTTYVCDICGLFAQRILNKNNQTYTTTNDLHFCPACSNYTRISKIMIPYAFKLVLQELMAMSIAPRIRTN